MRDFQSKRQFRKVLYSRVSLVVLLLVVFLLSKSVWDVWQKNKLSRLGREEAAARLKDLETRESVLSARVSSLQTDRGKEEEIRQNLSVVKNGEHMIMVVDDPSRATTAATTSTSWWQKWLGIKN